MPCDRDTLKDPARRSAHTCSTTSVSPLVAVSAKGSAGAAEGKLSAKASMRPAGTPLLSREIRHATTCRFELISGDLPQGSRQTSREVGWAATAGNRGSADSPEGRRAWVPVGALIAGLPPPSSRCYDANMSKVESLLSEARSLTNAERRRLA